ncbi:hypothetical protein CHCC14557_1667 [Bacillus licheniformis]|nr:hypothetical protein CHCC14557_1667 [Bacillus licheniformis]
MKAITIKGEHNMTKRGRCYGFTILLVCADFGRMRRKHGFK